ncbi:MAG: hypothetical protein J5449_09110 [Oscillospiraceae bacterium]|nr:hypothetical protein [Oscillospiraceae bacterium]
MDELSVLAAKECMELPDEVLDAVAGGCEDDHCKSDCPNQYQCKHDPSKEPYLPVT